MCKKASRRLAALSRISNYLSFEKKRILLKAFVELQFRYFPLMFNSRKVNFKINHIHKRSLVKVCKDNISYFEELLNK